MVNAISTLLEWDETWFLGVFGVTAHTGPKYLVNIVKMFLGNIVRLPKYFETYH